jgi:type I restriction enzyme S subunit
MGRCAIVEQSELPLLCGTGSLFLRPDNARTESLFLCAILSSQPVKLNLERLSLGQTLPNLNSKIVEALTIPLPPRTLQREFARRVAAVEKLKTAQRASLAEMDALFVSLQHRAFRGEL